MVTSFKGWFGGKPKAECMDIDAKRLGLLQDSLNAAT